MARKAREITLPEQPEIDEGALRTDLQTADQLAVATQAQDNIARALAQQIGYLLPADSTDPDLIQRDITANMRRSVEACLEVGKGLAVLKQRCPHGEFTSRLDVMGIDDSIARRFMQAAIKFSKRASTNVLQAVGNQTKLFELLVLDDEQLDELELTGQTGELALDDIATMGVRELRKECRELREQAKAKDRLLNDKNTMIDELSTRDITRPKPVINPWDEKVAAFKAEISSGFDVLDDAVGKLYLVHSVILQEDVQWGDSEEAERIILRQLATLYGDRLDRLAQQLAELQGHYEATLAGWRGELEGRVLDVPAGEAE